MSHGYRAFVEDLPDDSRRDFRERVLAFPPDDRMLRRATGLWSGRKPPYRANPPGQAPEVTR